MSFWKNKHLLVATITAPILGILSYFAVNHFISEKPHAAEAGQDYVLVEKPNCRYSSGNCGLKNGDFELQISFERLESNRMLLTMRSVNPLEGVMLALAEKDAVDQRPSAMQAVGQDGLIWSLEVPSPDPEMHRIYLAASSNETLYYGDVSTKFTLTEN